MARLPKTLPLKTVTVWTPSHMKNPNQAPLVFTGVHRLFWGDVYGQQIGHADLVLNRTFVVAVSITIEHEDAGDA